MKKWLLVCMSFVFVYLLPNVIHATEVEMYTYYIQSPLKGMQYGVYEDAECTIPLYFDDNPIQFLTNGEKKQVLQLSDKEAYIKQLQTIPGYYVDPTVYALKKYNALQVYPIEITYTSDIYPCTYTLRDENEMVVASWQANDISYAINESQLFQYEVDKTYTLQEEIPAMYTYAKDITFTIPEYPPEKEEIISFQHTYYGIYALHIQNEQPIANVKYALYIDRECSIEAKDIQGLSTIQETDENGNVSWNMEEGTYYVKMLDIDDTYYMQEKIEEISIVEKEITQQETSVSKPIVHLLVIDQDNQHPFNATIKMQCEGEETMVSSGEDIYVKRDQTYTFFDTESVNGYLQATQQSITIPSYETKLDVMMERMPFSVQFSIVDKQTKQSIQGSHYIVVNQENQQVLAFKDGYFQTNDIKSGTYTLIEIGSKEGYQKMHDISFEIPYQTNEQLFSIQAEKEGYVRVQAQLKDDMDNLVQGKVKLYADEACTQLMKDIYGNAILDISNTPALLHSGTYYYQVQDLDNCYYALEKAKIVVDHTKNHVLQIMITPRKVDVTIQIVNGKIPIVDATFDVLDNHKNVIYEDVKTIETLQRDSTYYVQVNTLKGTYTYNRQPIQVDIPVFVPNEKLQITIQCKPYITLQIETSTDLDAYNLYQNEKCTTFAKDIYGNTTEGKKSWLVREGMYYLKQVKALPYCYLDTNVYPIQISSKDGFEKNKKIEMYPVQLSVILQNENDEELKDGIYEIYDDANTLITSFEGSQTHVEANLLPNQTYRFHEMRAPQGYQENHTDIIYTTPEYKPENSPTVSIRYKQQKQIVEVESSKAQNSILQPLWYISWIVVIGTGLYSLKKFTKK